MHKKLHYTVKYWGESSLNDPFFVVRCPYHNSTPTGRVKGVWGHFLFLVILDVKGWTVGIRDVQEKIQHWVGRCSVRPWKCKNNNDILKKLPMYDCIKQSVPRSFFGQRLQNFAHLPSLASTGLMTCARLSALSVWALRLLSKRGFTPSMA